MADIINFQSEKARRIDRAVSDPTSQLEDIRDQLVSLNTAFDRLSETLGEFGTHMHKVSERLASVERKSDKDE